MKKNLFFFLVLIIFVSCKSEPKYVTEYVYLEDDEWTKYDKVNLTLDDMISLSSFEGNTIVERTLFPESDGKKSPIRSLQFFASETVVFYFWQPRGTALSISKDGYLKRSEGAQDNEFVIYNNTAGILNSEPEKRGGKYVLSVDFGNVIAKFEEGNDGLFYLSQYLDYSGFRYSSQSTCTLQYAELVDYNSTKNTYSAIGRKQKN